MTKGLLERKNTTIKWDDSGKIGNKNKLILTIKEHFWIQYKPLNSINHRVLQLINY